jgi:S-DNA-T family DNA segregation ATPase FtsK/SpoIIIE
VAGQAAHLSGVSSGAVASLMTYSLNTLNSSSPAPGPGRTGAGRFAYEIGLIVGLVALVFWLLALLSYSTLDPAWSTSGSGGALRNWGGRFGAWLSDASYFLLGFSVW